MGVGEINTRETVLDMLLEVTKNNTPGHVLLKDVLDKYNYIDESDKAFIKRLFEGTLERMITIDYVINRFSNTPVNKCKPLIRNLLRMSVYQILYMDRVPDSAAINEGVKLAKKRKFVNLSGFVNGVLRNISRNKENAIDTDDLSVVYSCPKVICDSMIEDYGLEKAREVLAQGLKTRKVFIRIREDISNEKQKGCIDNLKAAGIECTKSPLTEYAYEVSGNLSELTQNDSFEEGCFTVQDVSSQLVAERAGIKTGMKVLDVCAAPGGKTMHAMSKGADVTARDVSERKTALIQENAARLKLNPAIQVWDATVPDKDSVEKYDVVIADVPCSGFGVMGKKPDIKNGVTVEGLNELNVLQRQIVDCVTSYVKPGGVLMYSTCTLRKKENEDMVRYICEKYPFTLDCEETLFTCEEHDGFYIARLIKNEMY